MKTPSRRMPGRPERKTPLIGWGILALFFGGLGYCAYRNVGVLICLVSVALWLFWEVRREERRMAVLEQFLAEVREGESICTFARSFDWRHTDTWILRAVYEEMSEYFPGVPIRRTDRWADLRIELEDLNEFLIYDIAFRARRSMENPDRNPLWGKVRTVGDIVAFLEHQPRLAEAAPAAA